MKELHEGPFPQSKSHYGLRTGLPPSSFQPSLTKSLCPHSLVFELVIGSVGIDNDVLHTGARQLLLQE